MWVWFPTWMCLYRGGIDTENIVGKTNPESSRRAQSLFTIPTVLLNGVASVRRHDKANNHEKQTLVTHAKALRNPRSKARSGSAMVIYSLA